MYDDIPRSSGKRQGFWGRGHWTVSSVKAVYVEEGQFLRWTIGLHPDWVTLISRQLRLPRCPSQKKK